jgi:hypothetical protein
MSQDAQPPEDFPTAEDLRLRLLEKKLQEMEAKERLREAEKAEKAKFADAFLHQHVTEAERQAIGRIVENAINHGQYEALVYSFPSALCTDKGRAINNSEPDWPDTLQGKARELYERYVTFAQPRGYRLKAMIINLPDDKPGDVGLFLNWAP